MRRLKDYIKIAKKDLITNRTNKNTTINKVTITRKQRREEKKYGNFIDELAKSRTKILRHG